MVYNPPTRRGRLTIRDNISFTSFHTFISRNTLLPASPQSVANSTPRTQNKTITRNECFKSLAHHFSLKLYIVRTFVPLSIGRPLTLCPCSSDAPSTTTKMITATQKLGGVKSKYSLNIVVDASETNQVWVASYYWQQGGVQAVPLGTSWPHSFAKKQDAQEFAAAAALAYLDRYGYK